MNKTVRWIPSQARQFRHGRLGVKVTTEFFKSPAVLRFAIALSILALALAVAASVRRPAHIGLGNPKHDFFSGPFVEPRHQSGLIARPYWDRVRIPFTVKSRPEKQSRIGLRVRESGTGHVVRASFADVPALPTYPTEPLWLEFRFAPIEETFAATIEVFPLGNGDSHRIFVGMSRGDRFEAGSLIPSDSVIGDQDLSFTYEGPKSLARHGAALLQFSTAESFGTSIALAWALVIFTGVSVVVLGTFLWPLSKQWPFVARVAVGLALFIVASEIVFLTEGEISSVERFHVGPGADRLATATVIAWPIVVIAVILIMGQRLSVATPHRGQVAYQVARQLCIIGMPLATAAVATMTFGEESLGMSMVNGAATVLAAAAVLGTLSTAIRRSRIQ